jgi:hypothetical protein
MRIFIDPAMVMARLTRSENRKSKVESCPRIGKRLNKNKVRDKILKNEDWRIE